MTSMIEEYENGKYFDEKDISLLFTTTVFFYNGYPFRNKKMTKSFKEYMKNEGYKRLLSWAENKENNIQKLESIKNEENIPICYIEEHHSFDDNDICIWCKRRKEDLI